MNDRRLDALKNTYAETAKRLQIIISKKKGEAAEYFISTKEYYDQIFNQLVDAITNDSDDVDRLIDVFDKENSELTALLKRIETYNVPWKN